MGTFLEMVRERLEAARLRLSAAQQALQAATAEAQAAAAEFAVWNNAASLELKEQEKRTAAAQANQIPMNLPGITVAPKPSEATPEETHTREKEPPETSNKTEKVREIIRAREAGVKPAELWIEVRDYVSSRAYMYSILKRLRDNDEVSIRRGKYFFKTHVMEAKSENEVSQTIQ